MAVYRSTILPIIDYNDHYQLLWNKDKVDRLQKFQNRGLRTVYANVQPRLDEDELHARANVLLLNQRRIFHLLGIMYHRSKVDKYLDKRDVRTRQFDKVKFVVLQPLVKKAFKTPNYYGAQLWDRLPKDTQLSGSYKEFKCKIKKHITAGMYNNV